MPGIPIIGDIIGFLTTPFAAAAGWAWDTVVTGLTDWVIKGVLALLTGLWNFMDTSSSPRLQAEWFSTGTSSPFRIAFGIGTAMVAVLVLLAVVRGVAAGSPGAILRTVGHDLPVAVFAMVSLVAVAAAAVDTADGLSRFIWAQTRDDAIGAMDNLGVTLMTRIPTLYFLGIFVALALMVAMLFMWVTLFVRESLIYLVVIYAVSFGLPAMIFPPLRDTSKKVLELLVALIIAKPVMILALSVGISALGGVGATGAPGEGVGDNVGRELGTLITGAITFGLAAFMPFLVWRLMPIVAAAVVAQGIASAPMRGGTQAMQLQYYGQRAMSRLSGSGGDATNGAAASYGTEVMSTAAGSGPAASGGSWLAGGGAAAGGFGVGSVSAAPAAGPIAPAVVAASTVLSATKSATTAGVDAATASPSTPTSSNSSGRDIGGGA